MSILTASLASETSRFSPQGLAASGTEHGEQAALFAWCNLAMWLGVDAADDPTSYTLHSPRKAEMIERIKHQTPLIPELRWLYATPNGGERGKASAGKMKAEGVKSGVADIFWPVPRSGFHGLYLEMKRRTGRATDVSVEQRLFEGFVTLQGYRWVWTRGWLDARNVLVDYARGSPLEGM